MAYQSITLRIYTELTGGGDTIDFTVLNDQIVDWSITDKLGAADDAFEIYGRQATLEIIVAGQFNSWIRSKQPNRYYPEYQDAMLEIVDNDTSQVIFVGALRLDRVSRNFDRDTYTITLSDALDIWITQAKKTTFQFNDLPDQNSCSFTGGAAISVISLLRDPVMFLNDAIGWGTITLPDQSFTAENYPMVLNNYANDFLAPIGRYPGLFQSGNEFPYDWSAKYANIQKSGSIISIIVIWFKRYAIVTAGEYNRMFCSAYVWNFNQDNLLQTNEFISFQELKYTTLSGLTDLQTLLLPYAYIGVDSSTLTMTYDINNPVNSHDIDYVLDSGSYRIRLVESIFYADFPIKFTKLYFQPGTYTYNAIMLAMLNANLLHFYAQDDGLKRIVQSAFNPLTALSGGLVIPDDDIIQQQRTGITADLNQIANNLNILQDPDNLAYVIKDIYREQLEKLSCRLSLSLPETYYNQLSIFDTVNIDGYPYIVTMISYPDEGLIKIECVGEWN